MDRITAVTVNYNTPDFIERLIKGFRKFYNIPLLIVDGSDTDKFEQLREVVHKSINIELHHFTYNIHHGPGMAYAFRELKSSQILLLDSDLEVINNGFVEDLQSKLRTDSYGIGDIQTVNDRGFNVKEGIKYLHPACALINRKVALQFPMPVKHGAPMIETMTAIHEQGLSDILQHESWVTNDFRNRKKIYVSHGWQGTVKREGGYNL